MRRISVSCSAKTLYITLFLVNYLISNKHTRQCIFRQHAQLFVLSVGLYGSRLFSINCLHIEGTQTAWQCQAWRAARTITRHCVMCPEGSLDLGNDLMCRCPIQCTFDGPRHLGHVRPKWNTRLVTSLENNASVCKFLVQTPRTMLQTELVPRTNAESADKGMSQRTTVFKKLRNVCSYWASQKKAVFL